MTRRAYRGRQFLCEGRDGLFYTRVVIFADSADAAREVAMEIAHAAYWNSSYFGGAYEDIRDAHLW
jgi:hypothetical protein